MDYIWSIRAPSLCSSHTLCLFLPLPSLFSTLKVSDEAKGHLHFWDKLKFTAELNFSLCITRHCSWPYIHLLYIYILFFLSPDLFSWTEIPPQSLLSPPGNSCKTAQAPLSPRNPHGPLFSPQSY